MSGQLGKEQIRALKKQVHHLKVVVQTGSAGLTDAVTAEIDEALSAHELVKIRLVADTREQRQQMIDSLCQSLNAELIQHIGHICALYRPKPAADKPRQAAKAKKPVARKKSTRS